MAQQHGLDTLIYARTDTITHKHNTYTHTLAQTQHTGTKHSKHSQARKHSTHSRKQNAHNTHTHTILPTNTLPKYIRRQTHKQEYAKTNKYMYKVHTINTQKLKHKKTTSIPKN